MVCGRDCDGCVRRQDPVSVSQATETEGPAVPAVLSPSAKADLHAVHCVTPMGQGQTLLHCPSTRHSAVFSVCQIETTSGGCYKNHNVLWFELKMPQQADVLGMCLWEMPYTR